MSVNKLFIAGAGCGKTTFIVEKALQMKGRNILITTYTINNEENIKNKIIEKNGFIPSNINILTWFSFLIHYGANPYLSYFLMKLIKLMGFISQKILIIIYHIIIKDIILQMITKFVIVHYPNLYLDVIINQIIK